MPYPTVFPPSTSPAPSPPKRLESTLLVRSSERLMTPQGPTDFLKVGQPSALLMSQILHSMRRSESMLPAIFVGIFAKLLDDRGFLDNASIFTTIQVRSAAFTHAFSINDSGQIAGTFRDFS